MSKQNGVPYSQTNPHFRGGILRIFHVRIGHIFVERWGYNDDVSTSKTVTWWLYGYDSSHFLVLRTATNTPEKMAGFCTQVILRCNAMLLRSCLGAVPRFFFGKDEPKTCVLEASCVFFGGNLT